MIKEVTEELARDFEKKKDWKAATDVWLELVKVNPVYEQEYEICKLISDTINAGEAYKTDVENLGSIPNRDDNIFEYMKWHRNLNDIYNKHFKKK